MAPAGGSRGRQGAGWVAVGEGRAGFLRGDSSRLVMLVLARRGGSGGGGGVWWWRTDGARETSFEFI